MLLTACAGMTAPSAPVPVEDRGGTEPPADAPAPGLPAQDEAPDGIFEALPAPPPAPVPPDTGAAGAVPRSPAVLALLEREEAAIRAGNPAQAAAELERALRIAPRDRDLWLRLARVRLQQRQWQQAESMAMKCLSLAGEDTTTMRSAWGIVAAARSARGDTAGAAAARRRAGMLPGS